jgi:glycosyltransferase involved in cell wall biosynthesis
MQSAEPLAIVIPAYKPDFLTEALESIALQGYPDVRVYVCDDASPADLGALCQSFASRLDIRYTRFESNLGRTSLVRQWNRCVRMTTEPWVWLFGDDDVMGPGCLSRVLTGIAAEGGVYDLFHLRVTVIDSHGTELYRQPEFPAMLSAAGFAAARLRCEIASYAPDYVFSRAAFDRVGGFVEFPLAWCSDDATWIAMATERGIRSLNGPHVSWRLSELNISAKSAVTVDRKIDAMISFLLWLDAHRKRQQSAREEWDAAMIHSPSWLFKQMRSLGASFGPARAWRVARLLRNLPEHGMVRDLVRALRHDLASVRT